MAVTVTWKYVWIMDQATNTGNGSCKARQGPIHVKVYPMGITQARRQARHAEGDFEVLFMRKHFGVDEKHGPDHVYC